VSLDPLEVMARRAEIKREGDGRAWRAQITAAGGPLAAWGSFVYRRRAWILVMASTLLVISAVLYARGGTLQSGSLIAGTESYRADRLIQAEASANEGASSFQLVLRDDHLEATDPAFHEALDDALAPLRADRRVVAVRQVATSEDGHAVLVAVALRDELNASSGYVTEIEAEVERGPFLVEASGDVAIARDLKDRLDHDLRRADLISLPLALILLLLVFGSVTAALIPLGAGVLSIVSGLGALFVLSRLTDVSQYGANIVTLIGLGLAIDYSLFMVSRFREELKRGQGAEAALATTLATAGRAVLLSGLIVAAGLSGLLFYQHTFLASLGLAGAVVVGFAVLFALTLVPALLACLGSGVNWLSVPMTGPSRGPRTARWRAVVIRVMRRPATVLLVLIGLMVLAGAPFAQARFASSDVRLLPPRAASRLAYEHLLRSFPDQRLNRVTVVVSYQGGQPLTPTLDDLISRIREIANVDRVDWAMGDSIEVLQVMTTADRDSAEARDLVHAIRRIRLTPDAEVLVTGPTAYDIDQVGVITRTTPLVVAWVVAVTAVIIFLLVGSVLLPLKAVMANALSITASFGALTWIFQEGHLSRLLNFTPQPIDPVVPVLLFCLVFGASMDYEVLLLSRIREEYARTGNTAWAVARGVHGSGGVIAGGAAILVAVFGAFALADVVMIKSLGLGMAIAVGADATVVRLLVVPATMALLDRWNWWPAMAAGPRPPFRQATGRTHDIERPPKAQPGPAAIASILLVGLSAAGALVLVAQGHLGSTITIPVRDWPDGIALLSLLLGTLGWYGGLFGAAVALPIWAYRRPDRLLPAVAAVSWVLAAAISLIVSGRPHPAATALSTYQSVMAGGAVLLAVSIWLLSRRATVRLNAEAV
jgi:RND superfamily putative drug exporter